MLPPAPPSPPSGPPRGAYFSRRKLTQPAPPAPPRPRTRTSPSILANRVSSEPSPTFGPGLKRVPRWRTRIEPPVTNCPAKRFTPSIWGLESRPFLELPTPFLCAMRLYLDLGDADGGHGLPMPAAPPI